MSNLIPQTLLSEIPDLYETEGVANATCYVKLFTPDSNWTWFIMEVSKSDENICFGYVQGLDNELGFFSLEEIETVHGPLGLAVERDMFFTPTPFEQIKGNEQKT